MSHIFSKRCSVFPLKRCRTVCYYVVMQLIFRSEHVDRKLRVVTGWAYVARNERGEAVFDQGYGTTVDPSDLEKAFFAYMLNSAQIDLMHNEIPIGRVCGGMVTTSEIQKAMGIETPIKEGIFMSVRVDDDYTWDLVQRGQFPMFSIGGRGRLEEIEDGEEEV